MGTVEQIKPKRVHHRRGGSNLEQRVSALETEIVNVRGVATAARDAATEAASNTAELLALAKATKGAAAFVKKHGPRAVAWLTGIATAAGIGNPAVWGFIKALISPG